MNQNNQVLLHLNLSDDVGPSTIATLIEWAQGNSCALATLYDLSAAELVGIGLTAVRAKAVRDGLRDRAALERELQLLEKHQCAYTCLVDADYPPLLRHITAPPPVLYYRGAHPGGFERAIALVGARRANGYARNVVGALVPPLVEAGWAIVSGGAVGVDAWAHEAALASGGGTIVIMGSGLLKPYPWGNKALFDRVVAGGGSLVSPFRLEMEPSRGSFPARNRIIAGFSTSVVVVQAGAQSGALITAQYALEQGRQVCAVPGAIDDCLAAGCHQLIQQGATLVTCAQDIVSEPVGRTERALVSEPVAVVHADPLEREIIALCRRPRSLDELCHELSVPADGVRERLFGLQCAGVIDQDFSGLFCAR